VINGKRIAVVMPRLQRGEDARADRPRASRNCRHSGADIVVMVHPDYQYTPLLVTAMSSMVAFGVYDAVLGSRIVGGGTLRGGMPFYKYVANRFLAVFQNAFTGAKLSEYHTGSKDVLANLPLRSHGV
jgi:hypothetical protein